MAHPVTVTTTITSASATLPAGLGLRQRALSTKATSALAAMPVAAQPARNAMPMRPQTPDWPQLMAKMAPVAKTTMAAQPVGASVPEVGTGVVAADSMMPAQAVELALSTAAADTTLAQEPAPAEPEMLLSVSLLPEQRAGLTAKMRRVLLPVVESFLATSSPQIAVQQGEQLGKKPLAESRYATSAIAATAIEAAIQDALHAIMAASTVAASGSSVSTNEDSQTLRSEELYLKAAAVTTARAVGAADVTPSQVSAHNQSEVAYAPPRDILLCNCFYHPQWLVFTLVKQRVPAPTPRPLSSAQSTAPQSGFNPLLSLMELNTLQPLSASTKKTAASAVKALAMVSTETESVPLAPAATTAHTSAVAVTHSGAAVTPTGTVVPRANTVTAPVSTAMTTLPVSVVTALARAQPPEEALLKTGAARQSVTPAANVSLQTAETAAGDATVIELVPTVKQHSIPLISKPQSLTDLKNNLKALRLKRGLSQIELSQLLHTAQSRLSRWESMHDKSFIPDDMVAEVAQALEAPCQYLDRKAFDFTTNDSGQLYYHLYGTKAQPLALVAQPHTPQEVKRNLLYLRTQAHLTLRELKQFLPYCSLKLISQWENLACEELPLGAVVRRLAQVYHCPPELLMLHQQHLTVTAPVELQHVTLLACSPRWSQNAHAQQLMAHSWQLPFTNAFKLQLLGMGNEQAAQPLRPQLQEQVAVAAKDVQGTGAVSGDDSGHGSVAVTADGFAEEMLLAAPPEQVLKAKLLSGSQSNHQRFYHAVELVTKNSVWSKYAVVQLMGAAPSLQEYVVSSMAYDPSMRRPQQTTGVCLNTEVEEMAALHDALVCLMAGKDQFLIGRLEQSQQSWALHAENTQGQRCEVLLPRQAIIVGQVVMPTF